MDPNAAWALITDPDTDADDRDEAVQALTQWLARGGFPPAAFTTAPTPGTPTALRRMVRPRTPDHEELPIAA